MMTDDAKPPQEDEEEQTEELAEDEIPEDDPSTQALVPTSPAALPSVEHTRAISTSEPLKRYLEELSRYPLLEPEEEFRLAKELHETGSIEAAKKLVTANLRLVVKIALEYKSVYTNLMDLIQEGNIGLMKAVSKFDPTKGARLGYYASWWIRSYILKYLLDNFRLVKIGTTQSQKKLFYHLMREKERLEAQGLLAAPKLLAQKLDVSEKEVIEMDQRLSGHGADVTLDTPMHSDDPSSLRLLDVLVDSAENPDLVLEREQMIQILHDHLPTLKKRLKPRELEILNERLLSDEPKTLQEIALRHGLTRERARQIETKVIEKLKEILKKYL